MSPIRVLMVWLACQNMLTVDSHTPQNHIAVNGVRQPFTTKWLPNPKDQPDRILPEGTCMDD